MTNQQTYVIVGAGLAGAHAARSLRERGFDGRIVLLGEEPVAPYERPPLSKAYLAGETGATRPYVYDEGTYADQDIELRTGVEVTAVDPDSRTVTLAGGRPRTDHERIRYDRLLLTTGAEPRRLAVPGADLDGVHYLRTLADADRLSAAAATADHAVVIGAGWIGTEVAATLRGRGLAVTVLDPAATPLERVLGREVGDVYRELHADHGVRWRLGTGVAGFLGAGRVEMVRTTTGTRIPADLVVVGVGAVPRTRLAVAAGLTVGTGVVADEYLRTTVPSVSVAGDVAEAWNPLYREHLRVEHWANAVDQGVAVAGTMLGVPEPYPSVPYCFSDQYDVGMEYAGHATSWDRVVFRGDPAERRFIAFWLADGCLVAAMNVNVWEVGEHLRRMVGAQVRIDPGRLADPDVPVDRLVEEAIGA